MAVRRDTRGRYCVEFQAGGRRIFRRCPVGTTQAQAKAYEATLRREIFDQGKLGKKPVISLGAAIQLWLENTLQHKKDQRMPRQNAVHLAPFVVGKTVLQAPEAAQEAIRSWTQHSSKPTSRGGGLAPGTVNRRLAVLKAACRYAWQQGWVESNVAGRIRPLREPEGRKVYLTAAQVLTLARSAPQDKATAAIMLLAYSGLRASELLAIPKTPTRSASLKVLASKTGRGREVPVVSTVRPYLEHLPLGCSYRTLVGWFWQAREAAGMPHVRLHDLRHTTASLLANAGVDLYTIGKILGHRATQTTARYAHLTDATVRKAMKRIG